MKKSLRKRYFVWSLLVIITSITLGCVRTLNPDTGQPEMKLSQEAATKIDAVTEAAPGVLTLLGAFFPVLLPFAGVAVGVGGTWKRMKPKVTVAQSEARQYHAVSESLVQTIEEYKRDYPEHWEKLRIKVDRNVGANTEAVIRALRGLPPKD